MEHFLEVFFSTNHSVMSFAYMLHIAPAFFNTTIEYNTTISDISDMIYLEPPGIGLMMYKNALVTLLPKAPGSFFSQGLYDSLSLSPFPYTKIAGTSIHNDTIYVYHQLNESILIEEMYHFQTHTWTSVNLTIRTS